MNINKHITYYHQYYQVWDDPLRPGPTKRRSAFRDEVCQVKATRRAFAARRRDGRVVCWGDPAFGADPGRVEVGLRGFWRISSW